MLKADTCVLPPHIVSVHMLLMTKLLVSVSVVSLSCSDNLNCSGCYKYTTASCSRFGSAGSHLTGKLHVIGSNNGANERL